MRKMEEDEVDKMRSQRCTGGIDALQLNTSEGSRHSHFDCDDLVFTPSLRLILPDLNGQPRHIDDDQANVSLSV